MSMQGFNVCGVTIRNKIKTLFPGQFEYHLTHSDITKDSVDVNYSYIASLAIGDRRSNFHILDLSDEHWGDDLVLSMAEACRGARLDKFLILSHSLTFYKNPSHFNIIYFPHNYIEPNIHWWPLDSTFTRHNFDRKYFASCLNRNSRHHRIYNYIKLLDRPYYQNMISSMHNHLDNTDNQTILLPDSIKQKWNDIKTALPNTCVNDLGLQHPAYHDAYINLVTETSILPGEHFFTEKIYKPIACGQIFVLVGNTGSVEVLRQMGIDVFDDIIPHFKYDNIWDWQKRIDTVHDVLNELTSLPWSDIYKNTEWRRLQNMKKFFNGSLIRSHMIDVAEKMSKISGQSIEYNDIFIDRYI